MTYDAIQAHIGLQPEVWVRPRLPVRAPLIQRIGIPAADPATGPILIHVIEDGHETEATQEVSCLDRPVALGYADQTMSWFRTKCDLPEAIERNRHTF